MAVEPETSSTRRDELLAIAVKLFAEQGVAKTTVRDIADAAGILSGSLYHHFSSKDQMVAEAIGSGLMVTAAANRTVIDDAANPAAALVRLITGAVRWVGDEPDVVQILTNDKAYIRSNSELAETEGARQKSRLAWVALVESGIEQGVFRPVGNVDVVIRSIFDAIFGSTRWMYGELSSADVGADLAEFFLRGLLADGYRYDFASGELTGPT